MAVELGCIYGAALKGLIVFIFLQKFQVLNLIKLFMYREDVFIFKKRNNLNDFFNPLSV